MYQNPVRHQIPTLEGVAKAEGIILSRAGGVTCGVSKWGSGSFLWVTPAKASPGFHCFEVWIDFLSFFKKNYFFFFVYLLN